MIRANSYVNILEILQYFLDFSQPDKFRGKTRFVLNSNQFGKMMKINAIVFEKGKNVEKVLEDIGPSRKKFRTYVNDLLKEKLITEINSSNKKSHFYSITPWGICYLIKSEYFRDPLKVTNPNRTRIFEILEMFATKYVKPYKSEVFENEKFDFTKFYWRLAPKVIDGHDIGGEMPIIFGDYNESIFGGINFFLPISYQSEIKIPIADFKFKDEVITVVEWGKRPDPISGNFLLKLSEEQFHHYLANLLICLTVYFHAKFEHDSAIRRIENWKSLSKRTRRKMKQNTSKEFEFENYTDDFLKILFLFNHQISQILTVQSELISGLGQTLSQAQFKTSKN